mgnify:CR=1 FL=1
MLLVEDEAPVRALIAEALAEVGCRVTAVADDDPAFVGMHEISARIAEMAKAAPSACCASRPHNRRVSPTFRGRVMSRAQSCPVSSQRPAPASSSSQVWARATRQLCAPAARADHTCA